MGLDSLGYRRLFGVLGPSTNTTVQPDFDDMRPPGVTNHYSRIYTPNAKAISNETFFAGLTPEFTFIPGSTTTSAGNVSASVSSSALSFSVLGGIGVIL